MPTIGLVASSGGAPRLSARRRSPSCSTSRRGEARVGQRLQRLRRRGESPSATRRGWPRPRPTDPASDRHPRLEVFGMRSRVRARRRRRASARRSPPPPRREQRVLVQPARVVGRRGARQLHAHGRPAGEERRQRWRSRARAARSRGRAEGDRLRGDRRTAAAATAPSILSAR